MTGFVFEYNLHAREVVNGIWSVIGMVIIVLLILFLYRAREDKSSRVSIYMAIAWLLYVSGSVIVTTWRWALLGCRNRTGEGCYQLQDEFGALYIAGLSAIAGGIILIRLITERWNKWLWIPLSIGSILVPIVVHYV